jgi:GAF domain-containing protein
MTDQAPAVKKNNTIRNYTLSGVLFGLIFPLVSIGWTLIRTKTSLSLPGIAQIHVDQPLLWIIETAPIFLGIFAYIAGARQSEAQRLNMEISRYYDDRGLALNALENLRSEQQERIEKQLAQLNLAAQVARQAASIHDLNQLLSETTRLISDQFGFYHVGIFLVSPDGQNAVLRSTNSEGGQRMMERGHQLEVGKVGIVGYAVGSGEARIALDVGEDATFFNNPDLPETHSEMALPLKVRGRVIGALDVQSKQTNAFHEEDVRILQTLADQVALAIDNANLLTESHKALQDLQDLYIRQIHKTWSQQTKGRTLAFALRSDHVQPDVEAEKPDDAENPYRVQIPINLRGIRLGNLVLKRNENSAAWTEEEKILLAQASNQVALALDNARLYEETQARAQREQTINTLTANLSRSMDVETLLRSAVKQLGELPDVWEVAVHIQPAEAENTTEPDQAEPFNNLHQKSNGNGQIGVNGQPPKPDND